MKLINQNGIVPNGFNCRSSSIDKQTWFLWAWEVRTTNIITCLTIRLTCRSSVSVVWSNTTMLILRMKSASLSPHLLPFRGPGRKYYTSSLNAAIRYPLKRNELHQIYKQGATFPHIRHFCTSFSSADLSSSCWVIPPTLSNRCRYNYWAAWNKKKIFSIKWKFLHNKTKKSHKYTIVDSCFYCCCWCCTVLLCRKKVFLP